ncbi:MAG: hypothetical protein IPG39_21130 [Bacteroidetes bacterium]|nr:hypothetical protein [Bacteroidota bacterium]
MNGEADISSILLTPPQSTGFLESELSLLRRRFGMILHHTTCWKTISDSLWINIDVNVYDYELPDSTLKGNVNFLCGTYPTPKPLPSAVNAEQNGCSSSYF